MENAASHDTETEHTFGLPQEVWLSWKRKRRHTLIGCIIIGMTIGIDSSVCMSTILYYLRDMVKAAQPEVWYGAIIACFYLSSTICGLILGRWLDRTRKVRLYVRFSLLFQAIGFLIYTIPYHPLWLLLGRTICGIGDSFLGVITGELFRIYADEEGAKAILWMYSMSSFGYIIGPGLSLLFVGISFHVGSFEVNNLNVVGIFMAGLALFVLFLSHFLIHDCSAALDLKEGHVACNDPSSSVIGNGICDSPGTQEKTERCGVKGEDNVVFANDHVELNVKYEKRDEIVVESVEDTKGSTDTHAIPHVVQCNNSSTTNVPHPSNEKNNGKKLSVCSILHKLLTDKDSALIFISSFLFVYTVFASDIAVPLIVAGTLRWKQTALSFIWLAWGGFDLILLVFMGWICTTNRSIYFTSIFCLLCQLVTCLTLIGFKMLPRDLKRDIGLMALLGVTSTIGMSFDEVILRVIFGNMIPSKIQSFAETLRVGVSKIAIISASLTAGVMFPCLHWWSSCMMVLNFILMLGFLLRWKALIDPKEMDFPVAVKDSDL